MKKRGVIMKKAISFVFSALLACSLLVQPLITASALEASVVTSPEAAVVISQTTEHLDNGAVLSITVTQTPQAKGTRSTISGTKQVVYSTSGVDRWSFTLHGSFTYGNGSAAVCTASSYTYNIMDSLWELQSASASKSKNKAIGDATFVFKILGITFDSVDEHLQLSCSKTGALS